MEEHSQNSSYREKLIEHLFIGELLKYSWMHKDFGLEISKPEVDSSGYDLIAEANGFIRHIQLKTAYIGAKTTRQNIHISLSKKPSGCVIWIYFDNETLALGPYLYFGAAVGQPLPPLNDHKVARHTKANMDGFKAERPNIRVINKGEFAEFKTIDSLYIQLFESTHLRR